MDILNIILSNMYGPEDHFEEERSHALGALVMKFVEAKRHNDPFVSVWGSGKPVREWMHVDDGAQAMVRAMAVRRTIEPVNIGIGEGVSILDMALLIKSAVGYEGEIRLDPTKEDGAPYKTVDGSRGAALFGWRPEIQFQAGVRDTITWYQNNIPQRD
jgi:GDP-L-fucose synthase